MDMSVALTSNGRIADELRATGVAVAILGETRISRPLTMWRARRELRSVIRAQRPDVIVCHQPWPLAIFGPVAKRASVPLVVWMHMIAGRFWLDRLAWRVKPATVMCNSRFVASTLPSSDARIEVVYYPIDVRKGEDGDPKREGGANGDLVIIQVSRMEALKGHSVLIEALGRLRDRSGWTCWLAGGAQRPPEEQYLQSLRAQAAALGIADRIKFLGQRSDVNMLLAGADVYCQPNAEPEAFGISLIEALAAGLPVVTSAIGGATEIIDDTCGILVKPRDPMALASELSALLDDEHRRARLGSRGPARARALCDPAIRMPEIASILQRAAVQ
jgi:glycosyltransferase involved in cell wall biosynthesis